MPITGFFEDSGADDIRQKADLTGEVDMHFELNEDGDIIPRATALDPVFPPEPDVLVTADPYGWAGEYEGSATGGGGGGTPPSSVPTLTLTNDETGTSFTAAIAAIEATEYRVLRYRSVASDVWTSFPAEGSQQLGAGNIQVTGLTPGGYEVEAFARNAGGYGPSSVRGFVYVDDGTIAAHPVDERSADNLERLLEASEESGTLWSLNSISESFDPECETAASETYDAVGGLSMSTPKHVTERMAEAAHGLYTVRDWYVYLAKSELDASACIPKIGDRFEPDATGTRYSVISVSACFNRAGYQVILREAT